MNNLPRVEILLVEDNPRDAELILRTLQHQKLVEQWVHVSDGAEALDFLFRRGPYADRSAEALPKVILLDLKLPKVSGLEVLEKLKQNDLTRTIPVVVVTSSAEDPDIKQAYRLGANSYVVKPVDFAQFTEAMAKIGRYWLFVNHSG